MDREEQFYDILAYIAAAAREMYIDPQVYAPMRLLSVMLRLLELAAGDEGLDRDFLEEIRQMVLDNRSLLLNDREQFGRFLDRLTMKIAARNLS
jgi:hypothetical protein